MFRERERNNQSEKKSPFEIKKIEELKMPEVKVSDDQKLLIDGVEQKHYQNVKELRFQENNSNLVFFYCGDNEENLRASIIDINKPEEELLTVTEDEEKNILINGKVWNSLDGKNIDFKSGKYFIEFDSEKNKVVFVGIDEDRKNKDSYKRSHFIVVNDETWENEFESDVNASSVGELTYAFGGLLEENKLIINDKKWIYSEDQENNVQPDQILSVKISKQGMVVAMINSFRNGDDRQYISIGDKIGEKYVWKNTLAPANYDKPNIIAIDDENNRVAVFGQREENGETGLLIDDVPYKIFGNPKKLEYMNFKDGNLIIQYDYLGNKITEEISVNPDSEVFEEIRKKREEEERRLRSLIVFLSRKRITSDQIEDSFKKSEQFDEINYINEELVFKLGVGEKRNNNIKRQLMESVGVLNELKGILKRTKKGIGHDFKLSSDDRESGLDLIEKILEEK